MKKVLSVLLVFSMCFSMFAFPKASATTAGADISMGSASGKVGDTVAVDLTLNTNPGIGTLGVRVGYDATKLQLVSVTNKKVFTNGSPNTYNNTGTDSQVTNNPYLIVWQDNITMTNTTQTGRLATFNFKILANATIGQNPITISVLNCYQANLSSTAVPTTVTSGSITAACAVHTPASSWIVTKAATCTDSGTRVKYCTVCGSVAESETIPATGHNWGAWEVVTPATATSKGLERRVCLNDASHIETREIPMLITVDVSMGNATGKVGDTVSVDLMLNRNPGFTTLAVRVDYDKTKLQLVAVEDKKVFTNFNNTGIDSQINSANQFLPYLIAWQDNFTLTNTTDIGKLATFKFKILDGADVGQNPITISIQNCYDGNLDSVKSTTVNGYVKVPAGVDVSMGNACGKIGDTVSVDLMLNANSGFGTLGLKINYDKTKLQLVNVKNKKVFSGFDNTGIDSQINPANQFLPYLIVWQDDLTSNNMTDTGRLATFDFKILDNADIGRNEITVSVLNCFKADMNTTNVIATVSNGFVNVQHAVSFDSTGGSAVGEVLADNNAKIAAPINPTKAGYTFAGWYTAAIGGTEIVFPYTVTADATLYAQWTINSYTVTFNSNGGSTVSSKTADYNTTITAPTTPTRTGYSFAGWYTAAIGGTAIVFPYTVTADTTLYAQWAINSYTVTFNSNGGSTVSSKTADYNTTITAPTAPTRTGYSFAGWYTAAIGGTAIVFPYTVTADTTLYAQWSINSYTVTFNANGGSAVASKTADYNTTIAAPTAPIRTGYTFAGWYTALSGGTIITFPYTVTADTTLYAQWTINSYTVTFNSNGGSAVSSKAATYNTTITAPTAPTRTGYTFAGWYTSAIGGTAIVFPYTVTADTTLYAQWTVNSYTVTFNANGGSAVASKTADYNTTIAAPSDSTRTGYTFAGWYTAAIGGTKITFPYTVTADTTLFAQWTINNYTVTFNSNGGSTVANQTADYNTTITAPTAPTRTGYTFAGWYTALSGGTIITFPYTVTADTTLYAQWTINSYTVTFNANGGSAVASKTADYNTTIAAPSDSTRTGYTFTGWYTAAIGGTKITFPYTVIADTTLYAQWTINSYTVTFNSNGGSAVSPKMTDYNTTITAPVEPTKAGYTLIGWFTAANGGTKINFPYTITTDTTLYAQWIINNYTVSFDSNGGTSVSSIIVNYNATFAAPTAPTKIGYTFAGWYKEPELNTAWNLGTDLVVANFTLFAKWTINSYTVTFNSNGGSTVSSKTADYNTTITAPTAPTRTGYTFAGWYTALSDGTIITFPHTVTADTTVYAQWTINSYTVAFNSNGGSAVSSKTADYNTTITAPTAPTRTGYTFAGWYTALSDGTIITFPHTVTADTTLFAQWTINNYTVTFNSNGGSAVTSKTADYNTTITTPDDPTKPLYTFIGWFTEADGGTKITFPYTVTANTTLYAQWTLSYTPGDVTGDGKIDLKDVTTLSRKVAAWTGLTIVDDALDVNRDGQIDLKDVTLLSRYVAGWDILIY